MLISSEKLKFFREHVLDFFRKSGRSELPWRKRGITAYEVWVSEVMLQQTQVSRVIGYYERFLKRFPTVQYLARASWEDFLPYYDGLGYYTRGRNMLRTAQVVVSEYEGVFPKTVAELEKLPGIGPYTARAIASFAYGADELAWDTNLKRVMGRFFLGAKQRIGEKEMLWFHGKFGRGMRDVNAALMDFGSALCTARPKCANCPLQKECRYFRERGKQELGIKNKESRIGYKQKSPERVLVFLHEGHRCYFSAKEKTYEPFLLPRGYTTRAAIKDYFLQTYGLTLAVRPPHHTALLDAESVCLVNAQILLGDPHWATFSKSAVLEYTKRRKLS
jgi:A/G-specific adenine glycosylase